VGNFAELTRGGQPAIRVIPADVQPGQWYWRIVKIVYQNPEESGGDHKIYIDVLDENGARMPIGHTITVSWQSGSAKVMIDAKPPNEYPANFAMYGDLGSYTVQVDGLPSDAVTGMGLPGHVHINFLLTFQKTRR